MSTVYLKRLGKMFFCVIKCSGKLLGLMCNKPQLVIKEYITLGDIV